MSAIRKLHIRAFFGGNLLLNAMLSNRVTLADDFTAEKVMKSMKPDEQYAYIAGVIEGLAIARYHKDEKSKDGMGCIYDWFYKEPKTKTVIMDAFDRYPSYPPGSIIDVLVK